MKKVLLILALLVMGCSPEEEEKKEPMCCGTPVSSLQESYHSTYSEILANPDLTAQEREDIEGNYKAHIENPCVYHKLSMLQYGIPCR